MKTRVLSVLIIASMLVSTQLMAQKENTDQSWKQNRDRSEMVKKRMAMKQRTQKSFFTDEQKEEMKKMHLETAQKVKPLKNQLRELQARQNTLTTADNADLKAINKNIDKMSETKTEIAKIMAAQHQKVRSMMTEEQRLKFDAMKEYRGQRGGGKMERKPDIPNERMRFRRGA